MKKALVILLSLIVLIGGGILVKVIWFPVNTIEKSIDMAYGVVDKTLDSEQAIRDYEWFKQQEADIRKCLANEEIAQEAYDSFVEGLPEARADWSDFDKREEASLRNAVTALAKVTNNAIEDYNARSEMVNHAIFKDNLPTNISRAWYAGQKLTHN